MDVREWALRDHAWVDRMVDNTILNVVPRDRFAERPEGAGNSIAWLLWHAARTEDIAINTVVRAQPQVLNDWTTRLGAVDARIGTGLDDDEVGALGAALDPEAVIAYWRAVRELTRGWIPEVTDDELGRVPDVDERLATIPSIVGDGGVWVYDLWRGRPVSFFLALPAINHQFLHLGEMQSIRGRLGIADPR